MICFIVALEKEANPFLKKLTNVKEFSVAGKKVVEGTFLNQKIALALCGVGKVNSALTTQLMIDRYKPEYLINFGTAGGLNQTVKAGNYYLAEKCCQFDFDLQDLDKVPLGYIQDYDTVFFNTYTDNLGGFEKATLASADRFTECKADNETIIKMGCALRDMEGGAIAQVCLANKTPLISLKGITDVYGSNSTTEQFFANLNKVSDGFPQQIELVFKALKI